MHIRIHNSFVGLLVHFLVHFFLTFWAYPSKFKPIAGHCIPLLPIGDDSRYLFPVQLDIINPMTDDTIDMIMIIDVIVKAFLPPTDLQFGDQMEIRKNFEIAVDGRQTQPRNVATDPLIEFIGAQMAAAFFNSARMISRWLVIRSCIMTPL